MGAKFKKLTDPRRWEGSIKGFEQMDAISMPEKEGIVFVGSSTIAFWITLEEDMAPLPVIRRGFGGSIINDSINFADRIIIKYLPSIVVLYAGDNDIAIENECKKDEDAAKECMADFQTFVRTIHNQLPDVEICFISIKPSPSRWEIWPIMRDANRLIKEFMQKGDKLHYIDIVPCLLDNNHRPNENLYIRDKLHLNEKGYIEITKIIKPIINRVFKK